MATVNQYLKSSGLAPQLMPNGEVEFPPLTVGQYNRASDRARIFQNGGRLTHTEATRIPDMLYQERTGPAVFPETRYQSQEGYNPDEVLSPERIALQETDLQPPVLNNEEDSYGDQWGIGFLDYVRYRLGMFKSTVDDINKIGYGLPTDEDESVKRAYQNWDSLGSSMMGAGRSVHQFVGDQGRRGWNWLEEMLGAKEPVQQSLPSTPYFEKQRQLEREGAYYYK